MNSALEDVAVLERALESCGDCVETALPEYERLRAADTKALVRVRVTYPLFSGMILVCVRSHTQPLQGGLRFLFTRNVL